MRKVGAFFVYLLAFAVILAMAAFFTGYAISNSEENVRFVYVGDVNVSRLTRDETEELLVSRGLGDKAANPLIVTTFRGERFAVDPVRAGVAVLPMTAILSAICSRRSRYISTRSMSPGRPGRSTMPILTRW